MTPRVTMAEVAELAGVSIPTVSRVLAGKPDISSDTRDRVMSAANEAGYSLRGGPRRAQGGFIDILIEGVSTPWAGELLAGAERAAFEQGRTLAVTSTSHPNFSIRSWIENRRSRPSDGVVLVLSKAKHREIAALETLSTPLVLLDPVGAGEPDVSTVGATNWAGGLSATRHLIELGHTRIGFIGGPSRIQCTRERHEGYLAAHREFGIVPDPNLTRFGDFLIDGGIVNGGELLDLHDPPTAIFAGSDAQAAGVYQAADNRGLGIPADVSVVGFDDTSICTMLAPPLTTIRQPLSDMAAEAVRLIEQAQLAGSAATTRRVELATSLMIRKSTGAVAARHSGIDGIDGIDEETAVRP
jgi:DNA-binding LacI/PurR family transcriptional regulator